MAEKLMELVRQESILYDVKSPLYRDQRVRNESWERISKELNISSYECKEMWTKLRNCFLNALRRRRLKRYNQDFKKVAPWKYENQMAFLLPYIEPKILQNYTPQDLVPYAEETSSGSVCKEYFEIHDLEESKAVEPETVIPAAERKRKLRDRNSPLREILKLFKADAQLKQDKLTKSSTSIHGLDDVDMFYLSMAKTIKKLPEPEQIQLRLDFCTMVSDAQMRQITPQQDKDFPEPMQPPHVYFAS